MTAVSLHTSQRTLRLVIAAGMTAMYLALVFSPLASFAMHTSNGAPATARECSGDCNLCGCSPESRAANTCCCSKKRQQQAHLHDDGENDEPECCKKERAEKTMTVIACGCPCGNGKQDALAVAGTTEILPFHFIEQFNIPDTVTTFSSLTNRLISRLGEPPDPPPQNS